jgi:hypothetical protein
VCLKTSQQTQICLLILCFLSVFICVYLRLKGFAFPSLPLRKNRRFFATAPHFARFAILNFQYSPLPLPFPQNS